MANSCYPQAVADVLARERGAQPQLARHIAFHLALLRVQMDAGIPAGGPSISRPSAQDPAHPEQRTPLLRPESLPVTFEQLAGLWSDLAAVVAAHIAPAMEVASLADVVRQNGHGAVSALVVDYLRPNGSAASPGDLPTFILGQALRPFLWPAAAELVPLAGDAPWYRSWCPVCGGEPDMAGLAGSGERWLLCSRCDTEWRYQRLGCPFCANTNHSTLAYYAGGADTRRLYVCEVCRRYLKTVDQRERWQVHPLAAERVLTAGMDVAAVQAGYAASSQAAFDGHRA
jgi:hypothetical protein